MNGIIQKSLNITRYAGLRYFRTSIVKLSSKDEEIVHFPDNPEIKIPIYSASPNESIEKQKARLTYQSRKRGMLENDLILSTFAAEHLAKFTKEQTDAYDKLINTARNDWDIYYWLTDKEPTPEEFDTDVLHMLKAHIRRNDGMRIRQPDLN